MPIGMLAIYRLLFVCFFVCLSVRRILVTDISGVGWQGDEILQNVRAGLTDHRPFWWTLAQGLGPLRQKV